MTDDYVWDVGAGLPQILQDSRTQGGTTTTTTYLYGLGLIATTDNSGTASYYLADGLGSTTQLTDASGVVTDTYTYDVFGALRSTTGSTTNPFDFAGQQTDHNANRGLQYLRARHYDPALGRFLQRDPVPLAQRYAYAGDDPVNQSDPSGLACASPGGGLGSVGFGEGIGFGGGGICTGSGGAFGGAALAAGGAACAAADCGAGLADFIDSSYERAKKVFGVGRAGQQDEGRRETAPGGPPSPGGVGDPDNSTKPPFIRCPENHELLCRIILGTAAGSIGAYEVHLYDILRHLLGEDGATPVLPEKRP